MLLTGKIEVFKNEHGFTTGVLTAFDKENHPTGKAFVDVRGYAIEDDKVANVKLNVKKGYLNPVTIGKGDKAFTKLVINIVDYEVIEEYQKR